MSTTTIKYFAFAHLPVHLQAVSKPIGELAERLESLLPDGPEKSAGMRKLLEAKDCFVRTALDMPKSDAPALQPHEQRVVDEKAELDAKIERLIAFFDTPTFGGLPEAERARLDAQGAAMTAYSIILGERIDAFALPA